MLRNKCVAHDDLNWFQHTLHAYLSVQNFLISIADGTASYYDVSSAQKTMNFNLLQNSIEDHLQELEVTYQGHQD